MKKVTAFLLCLVLMCAVALPVSAASMSISASSSSVRRGESFTLTVSLSNDQPVSNGGVVLSYDTSVFEMTGGSRYVGDFGGVTPGNQGGVFVFETDTAVSGTLFTFDMKVKSGAGFGTYTISGASDLGNVECSLSGTSITVACDHSFGSPSRVDDANHKRTCSICGETNTQAHNWNSGTVTKEATCKETGTKTVTCTDCGATTTKTISKTDYHPYGNWKQADNSSHYRTCTVCGGKDWGEHSWNGEIVEASTCQQTGSIRYTCTVCGGTTMGQLDLAEHDYESQSLNGTSHSLTCTVCGHKTEEEHLQGDVIEKDEAGHFQSCTVCGYELNRTPHVPGPAATETTDQVCTECGWILQPMGEHTHFFTSKWQTDQTSHYHKCSGCDEKKDIAAHSYDNDCDSDCNICHLERQTEHQPGEKLLADETGHWLECQACGEKLEQAAHVPGPEATFTSPQVCTDCGYVLALVVAHDHVFDGNGTLHIHECICGERYQADRENCSICAAAADKIPWRLICMILVCVVAVLVITVIVLAILLGRHHREDPPHRERKKSKKKKEIPAEEQPKEEWVFE